MNIAQAALGELVAIVGYALLCTAVYKLFQIANHLDEIKALLRKTGRNPTSDHIKATRDRDESHPKDSESDRRSLLSDARSDE